MINLLDASQFMPRFHCLRRNMELSVLYILPNLGTFLVYSVGFVIIYYYLSRRSSVAKLPFFPSLMRVYAVFFFFCGSTHLNNSVAFIWPGYYLFTLLEWIQFFVAFYGFMYAIQMIKKYVP